MQKITEKSFNAKYFSFEQVADRFVPNENYSELLMNCPTILEGPRGCGKTTLLKMLTIRGLNSFDHPDANDYRKRIPFVSVYIPADRQWTEQIKHFRSHFIGNEQFVKDISSAVLHIHVLNAVVDTFDDLVKSFSNNKEVFGFETNLATELITIWNLERPISPDFYSISTKLLLRVENLNIQINKLKNKQLNIEDFNYPDYVYQDYLNLISLAFRAFKHFSKDISVLNELPDKWALCFDELEIAPYWIDEEIINKYFRSGDQKIILKITKTPSVIHKPKGAYNRLTPSEKDDYGVIRSWMYNKQKQNEWYKFCELLTKKIYGPKILKDAKPIDIFGKYNINNALIESAPEKYSDFRQSKIKDYSKKSLMYTVIKDLATIDDSFRQFLVMKNIDPNNPIVENKHKEDRILRKIKPLIAYRSYYKKFIGKPEVRSRKKATFYHGLPFIYDIADGNPRTMVTLLNEFLPYINQNNDGKIELIPIKIQSQVIQDFSEDTLRKIYNNPDANMMTGNKNYNLGNIIKIIGKYYFDTMIKADFNMDPVNCFTIDSSTPKIIMKLMDLALELGAIQHINPLHAASIQDTAKQIYRLSYTLFPHFKLPRRKYGVTKLSNIITSVNLKEEQQYQLL